MVEFDAIVLGLGGMGSAALFHLAQRGLRVLGIEQFELGHGRGSSHGQTRIIRKAYFEHPSYVPLLQRAYALWGELEQTTGRKLFYRTGMLVGGPSDGPVIAGMRRAASEHGLAIESLSAREAEGRFPAFRIPASHAAVFEPDAGYLLVEDCVLAHAEGALAAGAEILTGARVTGWTASDTGVRVELADGECVARALVVAAGPWAATMLADLNLPLEVRRKVVFWYATQDARLAEQQGAPVYGFQTPQGFFYGIPAIDERGVKAAHHTGGQVVANPYEVNRGVRAADEAPVREFIAQYLPTLEPPAREHSVCLYTMTPDEHFVVDRHPEHPNVVLAAGFSGHGFKFAAVIGAILADLALSGATEAPIGFLGLGRF